MKRWAKRFMWIALFGLMVIVPVRVAHSPTEAAAGTANPADRRDSSPATAGLVALAMLLISIPLVIALRRRMPRS